MNIGLITARGGSKGIPGKNLIDLGGRPLIAWTIEAATNSNLDRIFLSTDSKEIANYASSLGVEVPFLRPAELASDNTLSIDVATHAIREIGLKSEDKLLLLQPTSPFRTADIINQSIALLSGTEYDSVISVIPITDHHPERMLELSGKYLKRPSFVNSDEHLPRQLLAKLFVRNGAIYHSAVSTILSGSFRGNRCAPLVMSQLSSINIDSHFDLAVARQIADQISLFRKID